MSAQENKQRIRELVEIFNRGDLDGYLARYADDAASTACQRSFSRPRRV